MGRLQYLALCSLDGYVADPDGRFGWAAPDPEVHAYVNDLERRVGTHLYGRRMYEVMAGWDDPDALPDRTPVTREFAGIWQAADKVVFSRTLAAVGTARTRLERTFDPAAVRALKADAPADLSVSGPGLAAHAFAAGLVDDCHLFVNPVLVGGGLRALPDGVRLRLDLQAEHRFGNGVVHLHHRVTGPA